jgi:hypothetical protein
VKCEVIVLGLLAQSASAGELGATDEPDSCGEPIIRTADHATYRWKLQLGGTTYRLTMATDEGTARVDSVNRTYAQMNHRASTTS